MPLKFNYIQAVILLFFALFGLKFIGIPVGLAKFVLLFLMFDFFKEYSFKDILLKKTTLYVLLILLVLLIYSILITCVNGIYDFGFASKMVYIIYEPILLGSLLVNYLKRRLKLSFPKLLFSLSLCFAIQAFLTCISYFLPQVNSFFDIILPNVGNLNLDSAQRVRGFSNLGGAWLSVLLSIGVLVNLQLITLKFKNQIFNVVSLILCLAATVITGRTGLMLSLIFIFIFLCYWIFFGRFRLFLKALRFLAALSLSVYYFAPPLDDVVNEETVDWAFEIFLNDSYSTGSTDELSEMIYLPKDKVHLFFGVGFFENGALGYSRTDSGFIKTIFSAGLLGAAILYGMYCIIALQLFRKIWLYHKEFMLFFIMFFSSAFAVEFKEPFLLTIGLTSLIFLFYFYILTQ